MTVDINPQNKTCITSSSNYKQRTVPILYWRGAIDPNQLTTDTKIHTVIKQLLKNQFSKGCNLEKLKGYDIYSVRTNNKGRILFSNLQIEGKIYLLLLEYLPNHGYKNSKFLKSGVLERFRLNQKKLIKKAGQPWEKVSKEHVTTVTRDRNPYINDHIGFEPVDYYNSSFIKFNDTQGAVLNAKLPIMVSGPPGSGKSCVALSLISNFLNNKKNHSEKRVLFVCLSKNLAETQKYYWQKQIYTKKTGTSEVDFKSYEEILKNENPKYNKLSKVTEQEIESWLKKERVSDGKTVFAEFQILAPYSKDDYLKLGKKQSLYDDQDDKNKIWFLFQKYKAWLKQNEKYDIRFAEVEKKGDYDLIAVDEAADFSPSAMMQLYHLAKNGNISFFMDTQQDLEDGLSKRIHLKKLMFSNNIKLESIHLPSVYRCPKFVVDLANLWLGIKAFLSGGIADKDEYRNIQLANQNSKDKGEVSFTEQTFKDVYSDLRSKHKETDIAVITTEDKKEGLKRIGLNEALLFTSEEIKGLEFAAVIIYEPFESDSFKEVNKLLAGVSKDQLNKNQNRSKQKTDPTILSNLVPEINKFFTSITRTTNTLVICQKKHHHVKNLYRLLSTSQTKRMVSSSSSRTPIKTTDQDWLNLAKSYLRNNQMERFEKLCRKVLKRKPEEVRRQIQNSSSLSVSKKNSISSTQNSKEIKKSNSALLDKQKSHFKNVINLIDENQKVLNDKKKFSLMKTTKALSGPSKADLTYVRKLSSNLTKKNLESLLRHKKRVYLLTEVPCQNEPSLFEFIISCSSKFDLFFKTLFEFRERKKVLAELKHLIKKVLFLGITWGNKQIIPLLIKNGVDINVANEEGITPLMVAVSYNRENVVNILIKNNVDVNFQARNGFTALRCAAQEGNINIIARLIKGGANINIQAEDGSTALIGAAEEGYEKIAKLLIKEGALVNAQMKSGRTALAAAALNGRKEVVELLIEEGAVINPQSKDESPPLSAAAANGYKEIVELLIKSGAELDAQDKHGLTALSVALIGGRAEIVELLIKKGVDVNVKGEFGHTALILSAVKGFKEIAELLIKSGAELEAKDKDGSTALILAATNGHAEIVELLIKSGAEIGAKDKDGHTAILCAAKNGHKNIVALLVKEINKNKKIKCL